jgi:Rrf2 family protein
MFRISRRLDYGLQVMIALASNTSGRPIPSAQLSESLNIPLPFLHQIAHTLMQSGLIKATPGPRGGLRLNHPPKNITVLKIAEVLEGPICLTPCLEDPEDCPRNEICTSRLMWEELQNNIVAYLSSTTLEKLAAYAELMNVRPEEQPVEEPQNASLSE